jgi:hypothetical protein
MNDRTKNLYLFCSFVHRHGTRCAGEVGKLIRKILFFQITILCLAAAANNNICSVGVAYNARIGGKALTPVFLFSIKYCLMVILTRIENDIDEIILRH